MALRRGCAFWWRKIPSQASGIKHFSNAAEQKKEPRPAAVHSLEEVKGRRIMSGIQPTGEATLGNYLGAIKNWVTLSKKAKPNQCYFSIVDLHAITVQQDPKELYQACLNTLSTLLGCGLDIEKSNIFLQSHVTGHTELAWILSCLCPQWKLNLGQYREKAGKEPRLGLYSYPVLQAADILLYKAEFVPVGEDQRAHIYLCQDLAEMFNSKYETKCFPRPNCLITGSAPRLMSLRDHTKKMSKSDPSEKSRICLTDTDDQIRKKLRRAQTDSIVGMKYDPVNRPAVANLINLYHGVTDIPMEKIEEEFGTLDHGTFKKSLIEATIEHIKPIREHILWYRGDTFYLKQTFDQQAEKVQQTALETIREVKQTIGFPLPQTMTRLDE